MKYLSIKKDILAGLTYFNLFDYPLLKNEIFAFLAHCDDFPEFETALNNLIIDGIVYKIGDFYSLQNNYEIVIKRQEGNEKAVIMLRKAKRVARLISAFPFVKGVAVSGSLSKYFADENTDIDFFIITTANRLWIARTFLHTFKKITYLFKMQDLFCMNYFIDESDPVILEKNIYTAIEIATMLPMRGKEIFDHFYKINNWTQAFFPNKITFSPPVKKTKPGLLKHLMEKIFENRFGDSLDNYLMKLTEKNWNSKTRLNKKNSKGLLLSMHIGKHFSKPNPDIFQKRLLYRYENNLAEIFKQYDLSRLARSNS